MKSFLLFTGLFLLGWVLSFECFPSFTFIFAWRKVSFILLRKIKLGIFREEGEKHKPNRMKIDFTLKLFSKKNRERDLPTSKCHIYYCFKVSSSFLYSSLKKKKKEYSVCFILDMEILSENFHNFVWYESCFFPCLFSCLVAMVMFFLCGWWFFYYVLYILLNNGRGKFCDASSFCPVILEDPQYHKELKQDW